LKNGTFVKSTITIRNHWIWTRVPLPDYGWFLPPKH